MRMRRSTESLAIVQSGPKHAAHELGRTPPFAARYDGGAEQDVIMLALPCSPPQLFGWMKPGSPSRRAVPDEMAAIVSPYWGFTFGPKSGKTATWICFGRTASLPSASRYWVLMTPH